MITSQCCAKYDDAICDVLYGIRIFNHNVESD
jgi:hypothetical protein